jgi:hypothetical protein
MHDIDVAPVELAVLALYAVSCNNQLLHIAISTSSYAIRTEYSWTLSACFLVKASCWHQLGHACLSHCRSFCAPVNTKRGIQCNDNGTNAFVNTDKQHQPPLALCCAYCSSLTTVHVVLG